MKYSKIHGYLIGGALLMMGATACQKQLDEVVPQDQISTQLALTDANAARTLYTGVYATLRGYNSTLFLLGEMRSELWTDGLFTESGDPLNQQLYTQDLSPLNAPFGTWANFYSLLYQINNVIDLFPQTPLPVAERQRDRADMYGLRAYIYYTMLKTWGEVPLVTDPVRKINTPQETYRPRTSRDSIMAQIKSDLAQSLALYGPDNALPGGNRAYWNRIATLTLKGDVYLWSGTLMNGGTRDLDTARLALEEVVSVQGSNLGLNASYADIFDPTKKSGNKEIIFALNYELSQAQQGTFGSFRVNGIQATTLSFEQAEFPTVADTYPYVNGANRTGMNQAMIDKLTSDPDDQRIAASFKVMYSNSAPFPARGVMLTKWVGAASGTSQIYNNDFPVYRYADVLLLLAEAKAKLGMDPSGEINAIRQRAYGDDYTVYSNGTEDQNMEAILEEQLREFIGEGKRWWALRRAGDQWVYHYIDSKYLSEATVHSGHGPTLELPLSITMLNTYPLLSQTDGY